MIPQKTMEILAQAKLSGEDIVKVFTDMSNALANQQAEQISCVLGYVQDQDCKPGDYIPLITFVLTKYDPPVGDE
jgi:hypothetical protein